jgi:arylsulfatase A-like enzyme
VPPNVLFIVFDTARADAFEPYGAPSGSTPAFSDLGRRGAVALDAFSVCNWTMPSHVSMFTGALPRSLGLSPNPGAKGWNVKAVLEANADRVLAEVFRRAGYATSGMSVNPWIWQRSGFATGFDRYRDVKNPRRRKIHDPSLRARAAWAFEALVASVDDGAQQAGAILRSWLEEGPRQPFFWFVNLVECHSPYLPPRPYNDLGPVRRVRAAEDARRYLTLEGIWRACLGQFEIPDESLERMRHLYAREIRLMDDWLARLLEDMDRRGVLDDTIVIVTSDHGENLGEGRLIGHAFSLDDRLIRVPLAAAGPGIGALDGVLSTTAIPRIVAEAAAIEHPWKQDALPAGVAVAQYERAAGPSDARIQMARDQWLVDDEAVHRLTTPMTCATDGRRKLVLHGDQESLLHLDSDPLELAPSSPNDANGDLGSLRAAIALALKAAPQPAGSTPEPSDAETAELEERMRLMGYM